MTKSPDSDPTPMFDVDAPAPLTPVEQLLALADLYTRHNDRIDLLFAGRSTVAPDVFVSSARGLEREMLACLKTIRQQRLPAREPVPSAVVRLKQIAHLTSGATRYLTSAQQALPAGDGEPGRPDPRRRFGQHLRLARELTALAPATIVESARHIAPRLHNRARTSTTVPGMAKAQRDTLLEVARGHVSLTEQNGQPDYGNTATVDTDVLHHLETQGWVTREPGSAPPFFPGGPTRDRLRLTALGLPVLSTVVDAPLVVSLPTARPAPAPAATTAARTRR
ncbi:hypothetical protein [Streptomyces ziwulingensis]|uniref:DUF222 domain-containing protein n=1 Tax=Streptomyces ziwulingensis TaxID=1045501 RepID=A0ABP9AI88_9ACTN